MKPYVPPDGLQQERTVLAWRRSTLALLGVSLLVVRGAVLRDSRFADVLTFLVVLLASTAVVATFSRRRWLIQSVRGPGFWVLRDGRLPALVCGVAFLMGLVIVTLGSGGFG